MQSQGHQISWREGVGTAAHLLQWQELRTSDIVIRQPTLVHVVHGQKTVQADTIREVRAGQIDVIPPGVYDLTNRPGPNGSYEARSLSIDFEAVASGPLSTRYTGGPSGPLVVRRGVEGLLEAFSRARRAIMDDALPADIARHRILEVLEWLRTQGYRLPAVLPRTTSESMRDLFMTRPGHPWTAGEVAKVFCISPQTLRRRLLQQTQSFTAILFDVRMSCALAMLQSTSQSVGNVALACGYDSPSRFTACFRQRFGFTPTALRRTAPAEVPEKYLANV